MKLIKLNNTGLYIIVDDYNTKEAYDSRITKGTIFYKDELKDICVAEYSPASKVSRPVISCNNPYSDAGIKNSNGLPEIDTDELNDHLKHYTEKNAEEVALDKLVSILNKADVRKHTCINGMGYSQLERDIVKELKGDVEKRFTLEDMEKCFNVAKTDLMCGNFEQYKKYLFWDEEKNKVKTEWDIELEMVLVQPDKGGVTQFEPFYTPKLTNDGYVKIINIK
ncbi:MAG: hypothetical protein IPJ01_10280 [Micavibrio sp.]|nr:hypothetical protein [Micavibrio sp.]